MHCTTAIFAIQPTTIILPTSAIAIQLLSFSVLNLNCLHCYSSSRKYLPARRTNIKISPYVVHDSNHAIPYIDFKLIRIHHPDKGGDSATFRSVQAAFEVIRKLYEAKEIVTFTDPAVQSRSVDTDFAAASDNVKTGANVQPWDFYEAAEDVDVPLYHVELAKTGRARCSQRSATYRRCEQETIMKKNKKTGEEEETLVNACIGEDEVRIGSLVEETGSYSRWMHLEVSYNIRNIFLLLYNIFWLVPGY